MIAPSLNTQQAAAAAAPRRRSRDYYELPYTVAIDSREQHPYSFRDYRCDANRHGLPLIVPTSIIGLRTGDYSIVGLEDEVCVERKSLADLYSTIAQRRKQFEAEHQRMAEMRCACVVIEASLTDLVASPPEFAKIDRKVIYRTYISWVHRYGIPWHFCDTRTLAEKTTFRVLNWYWEEREEARKRGGER